MIEPFKAMRAADVPIPEDAPTGSATSSLPWAAVPKFVPGTTNVQEYVQKLKFLAGLWPEEQLDLLAPRAALLVEGVAFKKVSRIDPAKLKVKNTSGIATLVEAIGGSWGATELEERFEFFERALYGTVQRADEAHDSYLARMEAQFTELISRGTTLEEVQAYVLLRQSTLSTDDRKRIFVEHKGKLPYAPVVQSYRLLGSRFFHEVQGHRNPSTKTKVYDVNVTEEEDAPGNGEPSSGVAFTAAISGELEPELDAEYIDALVAMEDPDAMAVQHFEHELEDFFQETPGMHDAMVTYLEARNRLTEKKRSRGFWPVKGGKGDGKGAEGRGKSKGGARREQLLARIARSFCRKCGQKGHWKAECPNQETTLAPGASANVVTEEGDDLDEVVEETDSSTEDGISMSHPLNGHMSDVSMLPDVMNMDESEPEHVVFLSVEVRQGMNMRREHLMTRLQASRLFEKTRDQKNPRQRNGVLHRRTESEKASFQPPPMWNDRIGAHALMATSSRYSTHAILDTGASRCVIGSQTLQRLVEKLPTDIAQSITKQDSSVKFRFGNNQTLTSECKVKFRLNNSSQAAKRLGLSVEVVPGLTPFLLSKRAFKLLGGILDTTADKCVLTRLGREIKLYEGDTQLYLIDMCELCGSPNHVPSFAGVACSLEGSGEQVRVQVETKDGSQVAQSPDSKLKPVINQPDAVPCRDGPHPEADQRCRDAGSHAAASAVGEPGGDPGRDGRGDDGGAAEHAGGTPSAATASTSLGESRPADHLGHDKPELSSTSGSLPWWRTWSASRTDRRFGQPDERKLYDGGDVEARGRGREREHFTRTARARSEHASKPRSRSWKSHRPLRRGEQPRNTDTYGHDSSAVGRESSDLGSQAQGEVLSRRDGTGSGLSGLVCRSREFTDAGTEGLPGLRSDSAAALSAMKVGLSAVPNSNVFADEVDSMRRHLTDPSARQPEVDIHQDMLAMFAKLDHAMMDSEMPKPHRFRRLDVLEVYAGNHSPITDMAKKCGLRAMRFSRQDGDLASLSGRQKLWDLVQKYQPLHIWVAPECGPWSGWSRLNSFKSRAMHDSVSEAQFQQRVHVQLSSSLCVFQQQHGRYFHVEQPLGSTMPETADFGPIRERTLRATFHMCAFGLRVPGTNRFIRKASQVWTNSQQMFDMLNDRKCNAQHEHQQIAGSIRHGGQRMPLSRFCATYCTGFAWRVAKNMRDPTTHVVLEDGLVNQDEPPLKRVRFSTGQSERPSRDAIDLNPEENLVNRWSLLPNHPNGQM